MRFTRDYLEDVAFVETGVRLTEMQVRTRKQKIANARKELAMYLLIQTHFTNRLIAEIVGWQGDRTMVSKLKKIVIKPKKTKL